MQVSKFFLCPWHDPRWIKVSGDDCFSYLQSQLTIDIRQIPEGASAYALLLNRKGGITADFILRNMGDHWLATSPGFPDEEVLSLLEANVIADDVDFEFLPMRTESSIIWGADGNSALPEAGSYPWGELIHWPQFSFSAILAEVRSDASEVFSQWCREQGVGVSDEQALTAKRIEYGDILIGVEGGSGELPQEYGLEQRAVSFTKGCYLGQEVMARLKAMGNPQWTVVKGQLSPEFKAKCPLPLMNEEKVVGELKVFCEEHGLARIRRRFAIPGTNLEIADTGLSFKVGSN